MAAAMLYRGPDDDGFLLNDGRAPGLALGMRRLSIIDLKTGRQPVWNEARDVAVVFKGGVFNYPGVRAGPIRSRPRFITQSYYATLGAPLARWGAGALDRFPPIFTFTLPHFRN